MNFWQKLVYYIFYYLCALVGLLPAWFLYYVLAEIIYFCIYHIARYRVKVTRSNLAKSFPEKDKKELRRIERKFYRHLAEIFVDVIDLTSITKRQLRRRITLVGEAEHMAATKDTDWIAAIAHYGSWEYFIYYSIGCIDHETLAIYRPLHNKAFDMFFRHMRTRMGLTTVPMASILRHIITIRKEGKHMAVGIIGDQTPPKYEIDHWYDFLNQPTAFFGGIEKIATRFGMPVYFLRMNKIKRAHYEVSFEQIYDGSETISEHEITTRYAKVLEGLIRERPELWMWSHRRWKHSWRYYKEHDTCANPPGDIQCSGAALEDKK